MPRPPLTPWDTGRFGEWDSIRHNPSEGGCGVGSYPCQHFGTDLRAPRGTIVSAPSDGWIIVSTPVSPTKAPFAGYGPSVVLLAHDDRGASDRGFLSMRYSLLAHLEPSALRWIIPLAGLVTRSGTPGRDTVHDSGAPVSGGAAAARGWALLDDDTIAKVGRVASGEDQGYPANMPYVHEGEPVGEIGTARHVHWEVRNAPLAGRSGRLDPRVWLEQHGADVDWTTAPASPRGKTGSSGLGLLIALGLLAYELVGRR